MSFPHHDLPPSGESGRDERRSVRIALAAALLRHGRPVGHIANVTGVPVAMVEWLAEHLPPRSARSTQGTAALGVRGDTTAGTEMDTATVPPARGARRWGDDGHADLGSVPEKRVDTEFDVALIATMLARHTAESDDSFLRARQRVRAITAVSLGWLLDCLVCLIALIDNRPTIAATLLALNAVVTVLSMIVIAFHRSRRPHSNPR